MEHFGRKQEQEKEKGDNEAEAEWEEEAGGGGESTALFEMEATQPSIGESDTSSTGGSRWSTRRIRPREGSSGARYGGGKEGRERWGEGGREGGCISDVNYLFLIIAIILLGKP